MKSPLVIGHQHLHVPHWNLSLSAQEMLLDWKRHPVHGTLPKACCDPPTVSGGNHPTERVPGMCIKFQSAFHHPHLCLLGLRPRLEIAQSRTVPFCWVTVERLFPDSCLGRPQVCLTLMGPCNSRGLPAYEQADITAVNL